MIKVSCAQKSFGGFKALDSLTLHVPKGSVYGLVGPNGAGKTTIIRAMAGVYSLDSGAVLIDGKNPFENREVKDKSLYISDDPYFFSGFTIKDAANMYASFYRGWSWERFNKLKDVFKIDVRRRPSKLSKGMKKQVAFWLALSANPQVLLLDEPLDGLDPVMRRGVWSLIMQDVSEKNLTVLISSHNLRELEDVCDHVGIMSGGKIYLEKSLDDVKGSIHKLQLAFKGEFPQTLAEGLNILHSENFGSVKILIVNGSQDDIMRMASAYSPIICEILPLSLEEVFIYEMNLDGYIVNDIIL